MVGVQDEAHGRLLEVGMGRIKPQFGDWEIGRLVKVDQVSLVSFRIGKKIDGQWIKIGGDLIFPAGMNVFCMAYGVPSLAGNDA
jgi:hypothetical protein